MKMKLVTGILIIIIAGLVVLLPVAYQVGVRDTEEYRAKYRIHLLDSLGIAEDGTVDMSKMTHTAWIMRDSIQCGDAWYHYRIVAIPDTTVGQQ